MGRLHWDRMRRGETGGQTALQKLLGKFAIESNSVGYTIDTSSIPGMVFEGGSGTAYIWKFDQAPVVGNNVPKIGSLSKRRMLVGVAGEAAAFVLAGAWNGWVAGDGYAGRYNRCETAGDKATWTTPAGTTLVHAFGLQGATNSGLVLIKIDGDATLANQVTTAQDLVDSGIVANTCLVENGGTLNPTDRVWDQYATRAAKYAGTTLAIGLSAAAHIVELICTGYKNTASTSTRLYLSGGGSWKAGTLLGAGIFLGHIIESATDAGSVWEFAHNYRPTVGGTVDEWMGHSNSDKLDSWTATVDGAAAAPAAFEVVGGQEVRVAITSHLRHTESVPDVGTVALTHILTPTKLTINPIITWAVAGRVTAGYSHMMPVTAAYDKGSNIASTTDETLSHNDGLMYQNYKSQAAYMWDADGYYGALIYLPSLLGVNNFDDCITNFLSIEDRLGGTIHKAYASRTDNNLLVAPGNIFDSTAEYRVKYFPGGANAALAR